MSTPRRKAFSNHWLATVAGLVLALLAGPVTAAHAQQTYTLTYTAGTHGTISGTTPQSVLEGADGASVTAVADAGYHFVTWSDGVLTASRTDLAVSADVSVTADFAIDTHTITASAGANGGIAPGGAVSVDHGANQGFTITPDPGYTILDVLVDGVSAGAVASYTFDDVTADHTIAASFTVTLTPALVSAGSPAGTLSPVTDSLLVPVDISRTYSNSNRLFHVKFQLGGGLVLPSGTASITEGTFLSGGGGSTQVQVVDEGGGAYSVDGTVLGSPCDVTALSGNLFNIAVASPAAAGPGTVTITEVTLRDCNNDPLPSSIGTSGSVAIDHAGPAVTLTAPNGGFLAVGSTHDITWTAADGAGVASVDIAYSTDGGATWPTVATGLANSGSYAWTVPNTVSATARVRVTATDAFGNAAVDASDADLTIGRYALAIAYAGTGSGTVAKDPDEADYASGAAVALTATPAASSDFTGWSGDLTGATNPGSLTMDGDKSVTATFTLKSFTITASSTGSGSVTPAGATAHDYGTTPAYTVAPATGWHIADVKVDGVSVGAVPSYTFAALDANHAIAAEFAINTYALTVNVTGSGSVAKAPDQALYDHGTEVTLTAAPTTGWTFVGWTGDATGSSSMATVTMDAARSVTATFAINTFTLRYFANVNGSVAGVTPQSVAYGGDGTTVTAVPNAGYHFTSWSDGVLTAARQDLNVTADRNVTASFAINVYTLSYMAGLHGSVSGVSTQFVSHGGNGTTVTAVANPLYHFANWSDGVLTAARTDLNVTASLSVTANFTANPAVPAITALAATQVKSGNDGDGTTKVTLTWPAVGAGSTVQVYRAPFGNYPEYDDPTPVAGAIPGLPSYSPAAPWVLTGVTASGQADEIATRDTWYYTAFVTDQYGTVSPVSNLAGGVLNYHLGDVTNGSSPGTGNNLVDIADVSLLGAHYGATGAAMTAYNYLDVGPTTNRTVDGRPLTDNRLDFEDLVMFAINYTSVSAPQSAAHPALVAAAADELLLDVPAAFGAEGRLVTHLELRGTGAVQGFSAKLAWNPAVVRIASAVPGEFADELGAVILSGVPGVVDVARLGAGGGMAGTGAIANVSFERVGPGDPDIRIESVDARGPANESVAMTLGRAGLPALPAMTALGRVSPNPFRANASLAFDMARSGPVELTVFAVDGRVVRRLVRGSREPGSYQVAWDGRGDDGSSVAAGVYYVQLVTPQGRFSRSLVYLK